MKKFNALSIVFFVVGMMISGITNAQWTLQSNPLGSGEGNKLGKIQFVSATEGWINACKSGSLLHTTNKGNTWSIVTPNASDVSGSMSDPATNMSWTDASHGWVLKTAAGSCATAYDETNANGALLYRTSDGGNSWNRYAFPVTTSTTTYSLSDLTGTWQIQQLYTADNNSYSNSGWEYGTGVIDATGLCAFSFTKYTGSSKTNTIPLSISACGTVFVSGETSVNGFMSNDKQTIVITMDGSGGPAIMIMQKVNASTTYTTADMAGTWQTHSLTAPNASTTNSNADWTYGSITIDASGAGVGSSFSSGGNTSSDNIPFSINSTGFVTVSGVPIYGFMSADKQTMTLVMTEDGGYTLITAQKTNTSVTYSSADLMGKWQIHQLTTSQAGSSSIGAWTHGVLSESMIDSSVSDLVENGVSQDRQEVSLSISASGQITSSDNNVHGYMSADKQTIYLTQTQNGSSVNGYMLMVLQKDNTTSGDMGLQVQFADNNNGWATAFNIYTGSSQSFRSTDGGASWTQTPGSGVLGFYHFVDANNGWMIGTTGSVENLNTIYKTTDGGNTWAQQVKQVTHNGLDVSLNAIYFSDLTHGWAVGEHGNVLKTTDGGTTWAWVTTTGMSTSSNSKAVFFLDANTGWISSSTEGTDGVGSQSVLATKDGGTTWAAQPTPVTNSIFSLSFVDANHGWLTSDYGQIARLSQNSINITAGSLSAALTTDQKNSVTALAITGTMDARDFKTLRDEMPLLAYVDLSGVSVVEYTGTEGTYNTTSITYPANTIPQRAFYNSTTKTGKTTLTSFVFPAGVTAIDTYAFRGCGLTAIAIPATVSTIGYGNFYGNSNLAAVSIPSSVTSIGQWAFAYCNNLQNINIPSSVSTIGYAAFYNSGLNNISLSDGLTTIDQYAFQNCASLNTLALPKTVAYIGYCAFTFTTNLNSFSIAGDNANFSVNDGVLYNKAGTHLVAYPNAKNSIFTIPTGVAVIDTAAFEGATYLNQVTIPSSVTKLSPEAFYWCTNLNSVTIPTSVSAIGGYAFYNCTHLGSIHANASTPIDLSASDSVFKYVEKSLCTLYVPTGSKTLYQAAVQWKDFLNIVEEMPQVTYNVTVPAGTYTCYIIGEMSGWGTFNQMTQVDATHFTWTGSSLTSYGYKYCSGPSWNYQELDAAGNTTPNRVYATSDIVARWQNVYNPANQPSNQTYSVTVPSGTGACYIAGDMTSWAFTSMTKIDDTHYTITLSSLSTDTYKYCSGADWAYGEVNADGTDLSGNRAYASSDIVAKWKSIPTGINTLDAGKLSLYPNPATDGFYIDTKYNSTTVSIYNLSGSMVLAKQVSGKAYIDITSLQQGVYIVKINTEDGVAEKKLVKQ